MDEVRKLFEAKFPVPESIVWTDYEIYTGEGEITARLGEQITEYNFMWTGFRAAHELLAKDAAPITALIEAASGLSLGVDWNKGTHAKHYRPKLLKAIAALAAQEPK